MTKKIKKLEKETIIWRTKWENNNKALLQMAEEVRWFLTTEVVFLVMGTQEVRYLAGLGGWLNTIHDVFQGCRCKALRGVLSVLLPR